MASERVGCPSSSSAAERGGLRAPMLTLDPQSLSRPLYLVHRTGGLLAFLPACLCQAANAVTRLGSPPRLVRQRTIDLGIGSNVHPRGDCNSAPQPWADPTSDEAADAGSRLMSSADGQATPDIIDPLMNRQAWSREPVVTKFSCKRCTGTFVTGLRESRRALLTKTRCYGSGACADRKPPERRGGVTARIEVIAAAISKAGVPF